MSDVTLKSNYTPELPADSKGVYTPHTSKLLDETMAELEKATAELGSLIAVVLAVQLLLRKSGQFMTKYEFRNAVEAWKEAVTVLAQSYDATSGRNWKWVASAVSLASVLSKVGDAGTLLGKGIETQGEHSQTLQQGARTLLNFAQEKMKAHSESTKYSSQNEQQQVDELRGMIQRVQQATHDLWATLFAR